MGLRVVGAGFPRTGTTSLKAALERLLGGPCYHMTKVLERPDDAAVWRDAYVGVMPDWHQFLADYPAGVDWPISSFWRELSAAFPDAVVVLSRRESAERWYESMDQTVLGAAREDSGRRRPPMLDTLTSEQARAMEEMMQGMFGAFDDPNDRDSVIAAYERHLVEVRATVSAHRLVEWQPADGWQPLCTALGLPIPDEPFPHKNTRAEMLAHFDGQ